MGRITVFTLDDCPHCKRAKTALTDRGIPFTEISLSSHPSRRTDMMNLSDRMSNPQVFFNEKHIGGADETLALLDEWDKKPEGAFKTYQQEVAAKPDPTDPRLQESTDPPVKTNEAPLRDESDSIQIPGGKKLSVLEIVQKLKPILSGQDQVTPCKVYKNAFTASEGIATLAKSFDVKREEATELGDSLIQRQIIQAIDGDHNFSNHSRLDLFRLQCLHTPNILNSYRVWDANVDSDSVGVLSRLKKLLGKVESAVTDKEGKVDYKKAQETKEYPVFEEAVCELQGIDLATMDSKTRLAFGINLYNVMIKYSFIKAGIHVNLLGLLTYFTDIMFDVGGKLYAFHDLESGVLRGNRPPPYNLSPPIPPNDPRLDAVFPEEEVDCRIHFGLNCGARSCPPVKTFTPEGIDEELRIVAMSFADDDENVEVDAKNRVLTLSQIINWYRIDFAPSKKELPQKIVQFLRGEKKEKLEAMIDDGKSIKIKFRAYDWGTNASDHIVYKKSNLDADYMSVKSILCSCFYQDGSRQGNETKKTS